MNHEFELVQHPEFKHVNLLLVDLGYRSSHFHTEIELCVFLEGDTTIYSNRETYHTKPGEFILFNANEPHEFKAVGAKSRVLTL